MANKIQPETLLQLLKTVLDKSSHFRYISGIQPFMMEFKHTKFYVYVKNLSSAYFKDRQGTTRAQLPKRDDFEDIKNSDIPFIFLGYDQINDVLVCWNYHMVKKRLNEKKSVSFYSRIHYQEEVVAGEFLRKTLKNNDTPVFFKRKDLAMFFENIQLFFDSSTEQDTSLPSNCTSGKILSISEPVLLEKLKPLLAISTPHTLEAIKVAQSFYGEIPSMKFRDWANLIKTVSFED
ncbi:hypothetical protein [Porphyromonas levii]|uniref:hypothetical protein n=1 Tax=Porphyromonas levii TaxID=28114 RepID=UPI001D854C1B|nr:hypothetical protein [Porphyromonas levii]MBR8769885.1 hypothetical protein [Porphyromonas levii]